MKGQEAGDGEGIGTLIWPDPLHMAVGFLVKLSVREAAVLSDNTKLAAGKSPQSCREEAECHIIGSMKAFDISQPCLEWAAEGEKQHLP